MTFRTEGWKRLAWQQFGGTCRVSTGFSPYCVRIRQSVKLGLIMEIASACFLIGRTGFSIMSEKERF